MQPYLPRTSPQNENRGKAKGKLSTLESERASYFSYRVSTRLGHRYGTNPSPTLHGYLFPAPLLPLLSVALAGTDDDHYIKLWNLIVGELMSPI